MNHLALWLCLAYCGCQGVKKTSSYVGASADAGVRLTPTGSGSISVPADVPRLGCAGEPEAGASRPTQPAMGVSFETDGATIRLTESGRFAFYDATSLEERRSLEFPGGSRFVDHGDVFLVGEERRYWIGRVSSGRFSDPIEAPSAGQVQMSPSGSLLAVRHFSDDKLELSIYEAKAKRWRRIAARAPDAGPVNLCGLSEHQALWCPIHTLGAWFQDLSTGALTEAETTGEPSATAWSTIFHGASERDRDRTGMRGGHATSVIQLVGPGPVRWLDDAQQSPASMVLTCHTSNRALVLRGAARQMEMRTLPEWRLIRRWSGIAELVACSADGKRVAWVSTCDDKSRLVSISVE